MALRSDPVWQFNELLLIYILYFFNSVKLSNALIPLSFVTSTPLRFVKTSSSYRVWVNLLLTLLSSSKWLITSWPLMCCWLILWGHLSTDQEESNWCRVKCQECVPAPGSMESTEPTWSSGCPAGYRSMERKSMFCIIPRGIKVLLQNIW